jgi:phosphatidylglycerol:prolipoprotein diacylglycerol transferase
MTSLFAALPAACIAVLSRLHLSAYAAIAIAGILAALWLSLSTAVRAGLPPDKLWDAGVFAVIAAFVISRILGFFLLLVIEHGQLTLSFADVLSFSSISYLSLLVTAGAVALWLRWKRLPLLRVMDAWAPCAALLMATITLADAASGVGAGLPTKLPWGIRAAGVPADARVHPVALYSAALSLILCGALLALLRTGQPAGRVAGIALLAGGVLAFLLDMLKVPEQPLAYNLLDVAQWVALAGIACGACLLTLTPRTEAR